MKNIKRIINNIKFNSTVLGLISGAYTVNTLYNVNLVDNNISLNNKEEFYATSLIYGVLTIRFIYANHKESKELENDKVKRIKEKFHFAKK